jgi:hypothetical protein
MYVIGIINLDLRRHFAVDLCESLLRQRTARDASMTSAPVGFLEGSCGISSRVDRLQHDSNLHLVGQVALVTAPCAPAATLGSQCPGCLELRCRKLHYRARIRMILDQDESDRPPWPVQVPSARAANQPTFWFKQDEHCTAFEREQGGKSCVGWHGRRN